MAANYLCLLVAGNPVDPNNLEGWPQSWIDLDNTIAFYDEERNSIHRYVTGFDGLLQQEETIESDGTLNPVNFRRPVIHLFNTTIDENSFKLLAREALETVDAMILIYVR